MDSKASGEICHGCERKARADPLGIPAALVSYMVKLAQHETDRHIVKDARMCYSVSQLIFQGKINEDHLFGEAMSLKARRRRAKSVM